MASERIHMKSSNEMDATQEPNKIVQPIYSIEEEKTKDD